MKNAGCGLRQMVQRRIDVANAGLGLSAGGNQVMVEQCNDAGKRGRRNRGASIVLNAAAGVDVKAVMLRRGRESNIGHQAKRVIRHARTGLPCRFGEETARTASTGSESKGRAGVVPGNFGNV